LLRRIDRSLRAEPIGDSQAVAALHAEFMDTSGDT
jgi:hypothetical protein